MLRCLGHRSALEQIGDQPYPWRDERRVQGDGTTEILRRRCISPVFVVRRRDECTQGCEIVLPWRKPRMKILLFTLRDDLEPHEVHDVSAQTVDGVIESVCSAASDGAGEAYLIGAQVDDAHVESES